MDGGVVSSNTRLPSEILLVRHTEGPIRIHRVGAASYVEDKPMKPQHARHLGALVSEAIREVRAHEANGVPLAEKCEVCGFHHGIGAKCLQPRMVARGVFGDDRPEAPIVGKAAAEATKARKAAKAAVYRAERWSVRRANGWRRDSNKAWVKG